MPDASASNTADRIAKEVAEQAEKSLADIAKRAEKAIAEGLAELKERSKDYGAAAGEQFETAQQYVVDRVQERPVAATLTALGIGVVLGLLLSSGRRS